MAPSPEAVRLAQKLRALRESHESGLTQAMLARALSGDGRVAVATISSWESVINPKLPSADRLRSYALFFCTEKSTDGVPHLPVERDLSPDERDRFHALFQELVELRSAARNQGAAKAQPIGLYTWDFDQGTVTIICPEMPKDDWPALADERDPNYTKLYRFADLDALIELHGHIRASNPELRVRCKGASEVKADDLSGHLVLLGGVGWNSVTGRLMESIDEMPISQKEVPELESGEVFEVTDQDNELFRPRMKAGEGGVEQLVEDVGLLARLTNPFNHSRTVTICNGVHSRGVVGAVKSLTDSAVRERNEAFLASQFPGGQFALLMRVQVLNGEAMSPDFEVARNRLYEWTPGEAGGGR